MTRTRLMAIALGVVAVAAGFVWFTQSQDKDEIIHRLVHDSLTRTHYQPRLLDDAFSEQVFDAFFEGFDGSKRLLTQAEIDEVSGYRTMIDNFFGANDLTFFNASYPLMLSSVKRAEGMCFSILEQPFDLQEEGEIETDPEKLGWASGEDELRNRWKDYLRLRVVSRVHDGLEDQREAKEKNDTTVEIKTVAELEEKARKQEKDLHTEYFNTLKDMDEVEFLGMYLSSISGLYDPHSSYYAPREREDFEIAMTGQLEGIGAQLVQKNEYIKIDNLVSGGPAWKQGELEAGDAILKVAQEGEEPLDVVGMPMRRAIRFIRGKKGTKVTLTVKKSDGSRKEITIVRDVVEIESTFAKSAIIQGKKKVGYIRLPMFYVDFYSKNNHNAAKDVRKELEQLKAEGVEGIVLDLRGNGGGSLTAAIDMVGLFIPRGPVVQVKSSDGSIQVLEDEDPSVVWDGPLVVMVNEFSASASEIFAAAIQDYGRGLVVGSTQTYGKGTVQNMMDFDRAVSSRFAQYKPLGSIKLTHQKFYRITGETTQLQGVFSDVVLPDAWSEIPVGERELPAALEVDKIPAAKFKPSKKSLSKAQKEASKRVASNPEFALAATYAGYMKARREETRIPLSLDAYTAYQAKMTEQGKAYKSVGKTTDTLLVSLTANQQKEISDSLKIKELTTWHKGLSTDVYLAETTRLFADMK